MISSTRRVGLAAIVTASAIALLAGCTAAPTPTPTPTASSPAVPSQPSGDAGGDSTKAPSTPVGFTCAEALPSGSFDWTGPVSYVPESGTDAAKAIELGGIACHSAKSNGDPLQYSIALPSAGKLASLEADAAKNGTATTALGGQKGFFSVANGQGTAVVFAGGYWLTAQSTTFAADTDAANVMGQLINVLPAG